VFCYGCLGQKKLFHVREYLTPKDLSEKGLSAVLDAMEVRDYDNPVSSTKKRLLLMLWPDCPFDTRFGKYIQQKGVPFISLKKHVHFLLYVIVNT